MSVAQFNGVCTRYCVSAVVYVATTSGTLVVRKIEILNLASETVRPNVVHTVTIATSFILTSSGDFETNAVSSLGLDFQALPAPAPVSLSGSEQVETTVSHLQARTLG